MSFIKGAAAKGLVPCKRYIATHDASGKSIYTESPEQCFNAVPGVGGLARSFSVDSVPAKLANEADIKAYRAEQGPTSYTRREIVNPKPGANLLVVDLEPGAKSAMHRTVSIDFSICVQGEIDHELDGGEKVRLHPGVGLFDSEIFGDDSVVDNRVGSHRTERDEPPMVQSVEGQAGSVRGGDAAMQAVRDPWIR